MSNRTGMSQDRLALGAAMVTIVLWASAFVGIRAASVDLGAGALAFGRLAVGSIALGIVVAIRRPSWPTRRQLVPILVSGVLWFGVYNVALNAAERDVDAGTASMLVNIAPIMVAILGGLFLNEGFPPRLLIGCLIAFGGVAVISFATTDSSPGSGTLIGILLCFVCAAAYSISVTVQKPVLATVPALTVTWIACVTGMVVCLPFLPQLIAEASTAQPVSLAWLVYLGLFPTSVAFTMWAFALGRSTAGRLGSLTYLVPAVA
ncbi:MAG TPA: DMT family transporter, partial [Candidatus Limnocylindrales bacterium]|nr:DMT family transporter [Candidatus Limnocylindrales bacterium]